MHLQAVLDDFEEVISVESCSESSTTLRVAVTRTKDQPALLLGKLSLRIRHFEVGYDYSWDPVDRVMTIWQR